MIQNSYTEIWPMCKKLYDTDERNQRWHKLMERYTMFLDWKSQYCKNEYTTQSNPLNQCNPYQTTNGIFRSARTEKFTIWMETQKTLHSQSNHEKEKWNWRNQLSWLQTILQRYSHPDRMVSAQKWKYRPMSKIAQR